MEPRSDCGTRSLYVETRRIGERWAAIGDGWAVFGRTDREAIENFRRAEERHRVIDARVRDVGATLEVG